VAWVSGSSLAVAAGVFALSPAHNRFAGLSYAAAIAAFCGLGWWGTAMVVGEGSSIPRFAGHSERPFATAFALVSALGIAGFPLLPTFLGEDLLLHDTLRESGPLSALMTAVLALNGYLAVRNFAFTFLGQPRPEDREGDRVVSGLYEPGSRREDWARSRMA
jgi:formate hydrogenlyase subunit 3/multisubunit Na+/H+ antiporter MnhD subunit